MIPCQDTCLVVLHGVDGDGEGRHDDHGPADVVANAARPAIKGDQILQIILTGDTSPYILKKINLKDSMYKFQQSDMRVYPKTLALPILRSASAVRPKAASKA